MIAEQQESDIDLDDQIVRDLSGDGALNTSTETPSGLEIEEVNLDVIDEPLVLQDIPDSEEFIHVDQVELMWRRCGEKAKKVVWNNLYSLICALAMEAVWTEHKRMDAPELYLFCFSQCEQVFQNLHLVERAQNEIFQFLPHDNTPSKWPTEFCTWWQSKMEAMPNKTLLDGELKRYKNRTGDVQRMAYFGMKAKKQFVTDRSFIRCHLCPKWINPSNLPSGKTVYGLLHVMRESCLNFLAIERAKNATKYELKKLPASDREAARNAIYEKRLEEITAGLIRSKDTYFPDCWITYMYCSQPATINDSQPLINFMLSTGITTKAFDTGVVQSPATAFQHMLGRDRRRALARPEPVAKKKKAAAVEDSDFLEQKVKVLIEIGDENLSQVEVIDKILDAKQLELQVLQMLRKTDEEINPLLEEIVDLVRQKSLMYAAMQEESVRAGEETKSD